MTVRAKWALILLVLVPSIAVSGDKSDQRRVERAAREIYEQGIPFDAAGMSYGREVRLNVIPFLPPFGAWVIGGKAVAFQVDPVSRQLYDPRHVRSFGGGVDAGIGVGFPFSVGITDEIRSFRASEYQRYTTQRNTEASIKGQVAAGAAPFIVAKSFGPDIGGIPGRVESSKTLFVGLFARASVAASVKTTWPKHVPKAERR